MDTLPFDVIFYYVIPYMNDLNVRLICRFVNENINTIYKISPNYLIMTSKIRYDIINKWITYNTERKIIDGIRFTKGRKNFFRSMRNKNATLQDIQLLIICDKYLNNLSDISSELYKDYTNVRRGEFYDDRYKRYKELIKVDNGLTPYLRNIKYLSDLTRLKNFVKSDLKTLTFTITNKFIMQLLVGYCNWYNIKFICDDTYVVPRDRWCIRKRGTVWGYTTITFYK